MKNQPTAAYMQRRLYEMATPVDVMLAVSGAVELNDLTPAAKREASYALLLLGTSLGYSNGAKLGTDY